MSSDAYYGTLRQQIVDLCPEHIDRAFEIGCGYGSTLAWLKTHKTYQWVGGAEVSPAAAAQARERLDLVVEGDVERDPLPIDEASLDLLLCLDVLEHLRDPWAFLARACRLLKPGATFVASLPNLRHHSVVMPLLLRGEFAYQPAGILDQTHLRFFTRAGIVGLVESAGIAIDRVEPTCMEPGSRSNTLNKLSFGALEGFLAYQYIVRGVRLANSGG
jgi:SAM-dependent methyltransferase